MSNLECHQFTIWPKNSLNSSAFASCKAWGKDIASPRLIWPSDSKDVIKIANSRGSCCIFSTSSGDSRFIVWIISARIVVANCMAFSSEDCSSGKRIRRRVDAIACFARAISEFWVLIFSFGLGHLAKAARKVSAVKWSAGREVPGGS